MPTFAPCPTCNAPPFQKGGGPVTHRHRPGCVTMREERRACLECALPRDAGSPLCSDCQRRAVATIDRAAEGAGTTPEVAAALLALARGLSDLAAEVRGLRADLRSVRQLADAAMRAHPSRPAPSGPAPSGWTTVAAPTPGDGVRRVELD